MGGTRPALMKATDSQSGPLSQNTVDQVTSKQQTFLPVPEAGTSKTMLLAVRVRASRFIDS